MSILEPAKVFGVAGGVKGVKPTGKQGVSFAGTLLLSQLSDERKLLSSLSAHSHRLLGCSVRPERRVHWQRGLPLLLLPSR
jgi:hypothetical protein